MASFADVLYWFYLDKVDGVDIKRPKICWRNIGMVPNLDRLSDTFYMYNLHVMYIHMRGTPYAYINNNVDDISGSHMLNF